MEKSQKSLLSHSLEYIDPELIFNSISPDEKSAITCCICLGVVIDPAECKNCQTVFCSSELMNQGVYNRCPICKSNSWRSGSSIHKSYKSILSTLKVGCHFHPQCKDLKFTYEDLLQHLQVDKVQSQIQKGYYQFYYQEKGNWVPYQPNFNSAANLYLRGSFSQFTIGTYRINIQSMTQTNTKSNYLRQIKMQLVADRVPQPLWTVEIQEGKYQPYPEDTNNELQNGYEDYAGGKLKSIATKVGKFNYNIQYETMRQVNSITKTSRPMRRTEI